MSKPQPEKLELTKKPSNTEIAKSFESPAGNYYRETSKKIRHNPELLRKIITSLPQDGTFLDVGCGGGSFLKQLINEAKNQGREDVRFYAFDFSQQSVDEAKKLNPEANLYCDDILAPSNPVTKNQKFDYVFSKDVIFFFTEGEKKTVFNNLKSLTKLGGKLHIQAREERFDRESHPNFHDLPISGYRELFEKAGFKIDKSKIFKKIPYGAPVRENLDRFYPVIEIIGENMGDVKQIPNPTTEAYEYASAKRKENAQKAMGSSQMKGCLGR